jgi:ATP:ADP antiporter, AAA family
LRDPVYPRTVTTTRTNSAGSSFLSRFVTIEPRETRAFFAAFLLFFFMWAGYFSVRPVRETVATLIGRDQVADLWLWTGLLAILVIPVYGFVVARFRRSTFLPWTYGAVAAALALTGVLLDTSDFNPLLGKSFYVFISVVNLFLISMFWSFLLELFDTNQTKRLFGAIAAGGSAGALAGPLIADVTVDIIGENGILFVSASMFVVAIVCQRALLRVWSDRQVTAATRATEDKPIGGTWYAGVVLIARSPYLLGIALFIVGISAVSTLLYFEQLRIVAETFTETSDRTRVFARLDWIVQTLTVLSQIFLTGRLAKTFGVTVLLTAVPIMMIFGFLALAGSTAFMLFACVFIMRRAGEYAFVRPGREMLWSRLDKETKYKAKNTIDVPVYRVADYIGGQANVALEKLGMAAGSIMVVGAAIAALWGLVGWWLGRRFDGPASERTVPAAAQESKA